VWADDLDEAAARAIVCERFPEFAARRIERIHGGWDTHAFLVDERWIVRVPRRAEAEQQLRREAELLAALAPRLPSPVPQVVRVSEESPAAVMTNRIAGSPATGEARTGAELGRFLAALHALPVHSVPLPRASVADWRAEHDRRRAQFEEYVFPFLDTRERRKAEQLFASVAFDFEPTLVHGDLSPEHVLCAGDGRIAGVIDWGDARIGDPGIDLAWPLHGTNREFADAMEVAYGTIDVAINARAAFYHRRAPWYEVLYGLERDRAELVERGLASVRERL
jgi:aminoglycoside phosphotransferase (APT) family kinase protein